MKVSNLLKVTGLTLFLTIAAPAFAGGGHGGHGGGHGGHGGGSSWSNTWTFGDWTWDWSTWSWSYTGGSDHGDNGGDMGGDMGGDAHSVPELNAASAPLVASLAAGLLALGMERRRRRKQ